MLKRFFIAMLGSMAALWLSLILFVIGISVTIGMIAAKNIDKPNLTNQNILYINLEGALPDRLCDISYVDMMLSGDMQQPDAINDILASIDLAATDSKIKGVFIDCKGSSIGLANRTEIIDALSRFKKSGKWVYAYADECTQGDYYIASVADKIFLNPVGTLDVAGIAAQVMFFKDVLDKLGVQVQVVKVGEFKSAVEPFIRMDMSEPSYRQTKIYVDQLWADLAGTIAEHRDIDVQDVNAWADSLCMAWAPERYVESKAVDALKYRSEVEAMLRAETSTSADAELPYITPTDYMTEMQSKLGNPEKKHIAVLYAVGDIVQSGSSGIVSDKLVPEILKLASDKKVAGLVLRVNSGGGSAFASEQIWKALEDFKAKGKPFYVSMSDYAASGGYYISCGADRIYADPTTITGSIGIFGMIPNANELITKKIGLGIQTVATSPNAGFPSLYQPMTAEQQAAMQGYVSRGYETFVSRVSQGRNISVDSVKVIGGGRVWTGTAALNIGLVDTLATLNAAVSDMAKKLDLSANAYIDYPVNNDKFVEMLMRMATKKAAANLDLSGMKLWEMRQYVRTADMLDNLSPVQARMPYMLEIK